jgi:uncharacterized membrane protein
LGSEFIYIEDGFNSRLNTIFKLYYQAWLLLSIAGGFVLYELLRDFKLPTLSKLQNLSASDYAVAAGSLAGAVVGTFIMPDGVTRIFGAFLGGAIFFVVIGAASNLWQPRDTTDSSAFTWRAVWGVAVTGILISAFVYPVLATFNRTNDFNLPRSINGIERIQTSELAAITWLNERDGQPVIAEALGGDYSEGGRISATTGLPTILQWPGHELQWRGDSAPQEGREADLETLYTSTDVNAVTSIIEKYDRREQALYGEIALTSMTELVDLALPGDVAIYRVRPGVTVEVVRN